MDGSSDAPTTICDFLITDAQPCPSDCLTIAGLVLAPEDSCVSIVDRDYVWCATRGPIQSFTGACYVLADGARVVVDWTPTNLPSEEYCFPPNCVP